MNRPLPAQTATAEVAPSMRTRHRRLPHRGTHDRAVIDEILDSATVCHVGFTVADQPYVVPTAYVRSGDHVYIHGSAASRMLAVLRTAVPICLSVSVVDGLVLARSAFNHSVNYRSVMVLGAAREVSEPDEKVQVLRLITEGLVPGRWAEVREPNARELRATSVFSLSLAEASAKLRSGPPVDEAADYKLGVWAGVIPLHLARGPEVPDPALPKDVPLPSSVESYRPPGG